jgi:hypothetical protein
MGRYIHLQPDGPRRYWDRGGAAERLAEVCHGQGRLIGHMEVLGFELRQEAELWDISELVKAGLPLRGSAGGRSTSHSLVRDRVASR